MERTRLVWNASYPGEPYEIDFDDISFDFVYTAKIDYDIQAASSRQMEFYYNVSLPHYMNLTFLKSSIDRYKNFLYLKKNT